MRSADKHQRTTAGSLFPISGRRCDSYLETLCGTRDSSSPLPAPSLHSGKQSRRESILEVQVAENSSPVRWTNADSTDEHQWQPPYDCRRATGAQTFTLKIWSKTENRQAMYDMSWSVWLVIQIYTHTMHMGRWHLHWNMIIRCDLQCIKLYIYASCKSTCQLSLLGIFLKVCLRVNQTNQLYEVGLLSLNKNE